MKISIALATYNGEKYITEQLDSIRLQTRSADEVIIFDDRSSDSTPQIIEHYIKNYQLEEHWFFEINDTNLGYADNFHKAQKKTSGDYIFFCDQDDIWCKDKIKIMIDIMSKNPSMYLLCCDFTALTSDESAHHVPKKVLQVMDNSGKVEKIRLSYKTIYISSLGCLMAMKREFLDKIEPYWYSGWAHDDYVWKLAQCLDSCYVLHKNLIERRLHSNNVSMNHIHTIQKRIDYLSNLLRSDNVTLKMAQDISVDYNSIKTIENNVIATKLRLELFTRRRWFNCIKLLRYANCYHSKKSILMEPWILLHNK